MDPFTISMLVGGGASVLGSLMGGDADKTAAEKNAASARNEAEQTIAQAAEDERRLRYQSRKVIGSMRANYGASGIVSSSGSAFDVIQDSTAQAEMDALTIRHNGANKASALRDQASNYDQMGSTATTRSLLGAVGAGASAYSRIAGVGRVG